MRTLILTLLLFPLVGLAEEIRIVVGQSHEVAVATIMKHSGEDITSGQQILGKEGASTPSGIYWAFRDCDAILTLLAKDGKVSRMTYWAKEDFDEGKSNRAKTEQSISTLKIDTKTGKVSIEK